MNMDMDIMLPLYGPPIVIVVIGLIVAVIIVKVRKSRAERYLENSPGVGIVLLFKKNPTNNDWGDNNKIVAIDGEEAHCFTYKMGIEACYVAAGTHTITVKSSWGRKKGRMISMKSTQPENMTVQIKPEGHYSLEYHIPTKQFVFEEYENERLFPKRVQSPEKMQSQETVQSPESVQRPETMQSPEKMQSQETVQSQEMSQSQENEQTIYDQKYDDASWHYEGDYPKDLPMENSATHIGMFFQWCIENNLTSDEQEEDGLEDTFRQVKEHTLTGAEALWELDGALISEDLNDEGNGFATAYYETDTDFAKAYACYFHDYEDVMKKKETETGIKYETIYHFEDTYENYLLLKPVLDERFKQWKAFRNK